MSAVNAPYRYPYETVAASQTGQVLGGVGAKGDYLHSIIVTVNTAANSTVTILDGATSIPLMPAAVGGGVGVYNIPIQLASQSGPWSVTTGSGVTVIGVGIFSA